MLFDAQIRLTRFSFVGGYLRSFSGHFYRTQVYLQGPTGRGFQLRDGSGSGIGKKNFWDGSGMDWVRVFALYIYSIGYYRVVIILIGYFSGISLRHINLMVPVAGGPLWC